MPGSDSEDRLGSGKGRGIRNKKIREAIYQRYRQAKAERKSEKRRQQAEEEKADPSKRVERLANNVPKTQENTREHDETYVDEDDQEVEDDQEQDEFAPYFSGQAPKVLITTSRCATAVANQFGKELETVFPNSKFVRRGSGYTIEQIIQFCNNREYTDTIVLHEDRRKLFALTIIHLPEGPTAHFKLSNPESMYSLDENVVITPHHPELILNNFTTRLGHSVGRFFAALFPQVPEFQGRQVATFHNQRDFIFFRRHRYDFVSGERANLKEIGPRFTLRLRWLQKGPYNPSHGEFEWSFKPAMETSRRRFFL